MWLFLIAQIVISAPPASPAEAVRVLRASHSPQDLTDYRAAPAPEMRPIVWRDAPRPVVRKDHTIVVVAPARLQPEPMIGQCWGGTSCIVGPPEVIVREIRK